MTDPNGNSITYSYSKDSGQVYPAGITYTNKSTSTGIFSVNFSLAARATSTASLSVTGFPVQTKYQVNQITMNTNGTSTRLYSLTYKPGDNGSRTLLGSITETGQNASGTVTLPSTTFAYSTSTPTLATSTWSVPMTFVTGGVDKGVVMSDVNGDGLVDMVQDYYVQNVSSTQNVYLNTGSGWTLSSSTPPCYFVWNPQFLSQGGPIANQGGGGRLVDLNGDGLPDFICNTSAYINTGSGWTASTTWNTPVGTTQGDGLGNTVDNGVRWADVNGDGLPDIINAVMHVVNGTPVYTQRVWLNNGSGWTYSSAWTFPTTFYFIGDYGNDGGGRLADVNGDGLVDLMDGNSGTVYINNGHGWTADPAWTMPSGVSATSPSVHFVDVNGDGLADIEYSAALCRQSMFRHHLFGTTMPVYLNTGSGWKLDTSRYIPYPFAVSTSQEIQETGDQQGNMNGNGLADQIASGNTAGVNFGGVMFTQGDTLIFLKELLNLLENR